MAAGNDNAGLKAATAIFGALTLLLAVACYFLYSSYADTSQQLVKAKADQSKSDQEKGQALDNFRKARELMGFGNDKYLAYDDISKDYSVKKAELQKQVDSIGSSIETALSAAEADAKNSNLANLPDEIAKLRGDGVQIRQQYNADKDLMSQLDRLAKLSGNVSALLAQLSRDNIGLRRSLVSVDSINKSQRQIAEQARDDKANETVKIQKENDEQQSTMRGDLGRLQKENTDLTQQTESLRTEMADKEKKSTDELAQLRGINEEYRERLEKNDVQLDTPDGRIVSVDLRRGEVQADITKSMGVRPQMIMSIFDKNSPGLPTDRPKGSIVITSATDSGSVAKILNTTDIGNPIVPGDIVYSAAWSPNEPERFALIGKLDMNQDGQDDRANVARMIERAGGIVDFDLAPPGARKLNLPANAKLDARIRWYVMDDRELFRDSKADAGVMTEAEQKFLGEQKKAVDEARRNGLRPMRLQKLASYLNVANGDRGVPQVGSSTYRNDRTIDSVLYPKGRPATPEAAPAADSPDSADPDAKKDDSAANP